MAHAGLGGINSGRINIMSKTTLPELRPSELKEEVATFGAHIKQIRRNVGKFVLIQGKSVVDYFDTYTQAIEAGYEMFGLKNFFVRQVNAKESAINVMRCSIPRAYRSRFRSQRRKSVSS